MRNKFMKNFKKNKLLFSIILTVLSVTLITTVTFSVTNAWYAGIFDGTVSVSGTMGKVIIDINNPTPANGEVIQIDNTSTIPIILRVRVIPELIPGANAKGTPDASLIDVNLDLNDTEWTKVTTADGGIFFVYGSYTKDSYGAYTTIFEDDLIPSFTCNISYSSSGSADWTPKVTLVAEALQATEKAYTYTTDTTNNKNATSWALS